jgi:death-on-curing protein
MRYLSKQHIIRLNKATIDVHGGNFMPPHNFLHEENLDYLIEAVQAEMFGEPLYATISDKAAVYYNIICNHIFSDGNKRTGLETALAFLKFNGKRLKRHFHLINYMNSFLNLPLDNLIWKNVKYGLLKI